MNEILTAIETIGVGNVLVASVLFGGVLWLRSMLANSQALVTDARTSSTQAQAISGMSTSFNDQMVFLQRQITDLQNATAQRIEAHAEERGGLKATIRDLEAQLGTYKSNEQATRQLIEQLQGQVRDLEQRMGAMEKSHLEQLAEQAESYQQQLDTKDSLIEELKTESARMRQRISDLEGEISQFKQFEATLETEH